MSALVVLWIGGFALLTTWVVLSAGARAVGQVGRAELAATALGIAGLAAVGAWAWGIEPARTGMETIRTSSPERALQSPPRARLFVHRVRAPLDARGKGLRVGYSIDAGLRLPRAYGFDEASRGWDLFQLTAVGERVLLASWLPPAEPTGTRVIVDAVRAAGDARLGDYARAARRLLVDGRCERTFPPRTVAVADPASAVIAVVCRGDDPVAALAFERGGGALAVTPMVWRGGQFRPHHVQVASGSLLQIGNLVDAVPGVELWEVPAPAGRAELFFPPDDLLAPCSDWERAVVGNVAADTRSPLSRPPPSSVCVLPFSPPFGLEVRRLVPDVGGITARTAWATAALIVPALGLLFALSVRRRSRLLRSELAPALALAWVSILLAALAVFRLLWAHRIDMLRDYEVVGWRVVQNEVTIALVAAALAANAALIATSGRRAAVRVAVALAAWGVQLAIISRALSVDFDLAPRAQSLLGQAAVSIALGLAPLLSPLLSRISVDQRWRRAIGLVLGLALFALVARVFAPRAVMLKLAVAWAVVIASYGALRLCAIRDDLAGARSLSALAAALLAGAASAIYDPGIAAAIVCPGFALAVVMAAHDARFADSSLRRVATYRLDHAPVAIAQTAVAFGVGLALAGLAGRQLLLTLGGEVDGTWSLLLTRASLHLLLVIALLVAPAAVVALRRRGVVAALPWLAVVAAATTAWAARDHIARALMESGSQAAHRIAIVLEPGYALLRDDTRFLAGLTAWRETALPAGAAVADGQGYFGAQLLDPGVLLSVDNDYLPILLLRETGAVGILAVAIALLIFVAGLWLIAGQRFHHASGAQRRRALVAAVLGVVSVYQPLAALGGLPLTGVAWPGLGLDSPSDQWIFFALACWIALWGTRGGDDAGDDAIGRYDAELRGERRFQRLRWAIGAATVAVAIGALATLARTAQFAARRPGPVDARGEAIEPFDRLGRAVVYARELTCGDHAPSGDAAAVVPVDLVGRPTSNATRRFHAAAEQTWRWARPYIVAELEAFRDGDRACRGRAGVVRFERSADTCRAEVDLGWPAIRMSARVEDGALAATCEVDIPSAPLRALRLPATRPFRDARIRLVSKAMGVAASDRGELVSGHITIRLRPGAGELAVDHLDAGAYTAQRVTIGDEIAIELRGDRVRLVRRSEPDPAEPEPDSWLFVRGAPESVQVVAAESETWRRQPADQPEIDLASTALLVVDGGPARSLWLFRPAAAWSDEEPAPVVNPLVADDSWTVRGERRRFYVYGGLLPEIGWVNRFRERGSMGLDGWVRVAASEYGGDDRAASPPALCGSLAPPAVELGRVCAPNRIDGVLECRVAVQPELAIRLAHLTELIALDPNAFASRGKTRPEWTLPVRGGYALLRGDTGEIVAQGQFVPGRESLVYAPATPELEQILIRHREDRDPATGELLPKELRGEASSERVDWNAPIAVGSTLKPMLARALELADPVFSRALSIEGARFSGAECRGGRSHRVLGHCPPTDSLWNRQGRATMSDFLAHSANWFQAAIGLLGTAVPGGQWGFGGESSPPTPFLLRNVGDHREDAPLWTSSQGEEVITRSSRVRVDPLRRTAMWRELERLLGRPLCSLGGKPACERAAQRGDLCAARALPIRDPTRDLRHLVSLGPGSFDFYPELADSQRTLTAVSTREYLQFLRGSGLHPVGSLAQLADAFNRLVYEPSPGAGGGYRLAASWFPSPVVSRPPGQSCSLGDGSTSVRAGLCRSIHDGTARALLPLLSEDGVVVYAAKTGTIDSLADIAEQRAACREFDRAHTVPDRAATGAEQPYWLGCGRGQSGIDDSLLLLSFGVVDDTGTIVPLSLALRFQRSGAGLATHVARHYVDVIRDYFAPVTRSD